MKNLLVINLIVSPYLILVLVLGLAFYGCGEAPKPEAANLVRPKANLQLDLMMAKAQLTGTNFERYNLNQSRLWSECGEVIKRQPRPVFVAREAVPTEVEPQLLLELEDAYEKIEQLLIKRGSLKTNLPKPENPFVFLDDGIFELKILAPDNIPVIVTSFEAVKDRQNPLLAQIEELTLLLRLATKRSPCGQKKFFGLG